MLRIALQAEVANLQAEADALRAEAVAEGRLVDAAIAPAETEGGAEAAAGEPAGSGAAPADAVEGGEVREATADNVAAIADADVAASEEQRET